ncbi:gamma-glutamyltransferase [Roseivivax isoporae]|uniref:Glutathione hydrolase proenzyme n=1 Tax=Roseivivax isoporae LMG 25204 TaxID=1449351 RepID=X7F6V0_9RHOB|nr:gamma-glutamyltransferase [Roseivivax isoporae]ETX28632.1 gamma-glutamyltransferase [Roseivivax isoporae LMG 25204]
MRDFHFPGRSAVHAVNAMAASSHPLATEAALHVLRDGGSAMDAAIAGSAVMAVVEPQMTGIGGDCFALVAPAGHGAVVAFNGSGRAPAAATPEALAAEGLDAIAIDSVHSVTLPGAIDGWFRLHARFGRLDMARLLAPAIAQARDGYPVHARVAADWRRATGHLARRDATRAAFLPGGRAPAEGDLHRQPALARTLETIARQGPGGFYGGAVAAAMTRTLRTHGGLHTEEDFHGVAGDFVAPLSTGYRGRTVHQVPPNNQGLTALMMLNLLERFDVAALRPGSAARLHLEIETARLAYAMRDRHIAEAGAMQVDPQEILSKDLAATLAARLSPDTAMTDVEPLGLRTSDTVYMTVVDRDGCAVSFINSIFDSFGSGILCPETGVLFQNRGHSFTLDPSHPNVLAPGKRPMHTIMPGMVTEDGRPVLSFGVMGGDYQPIGQARVISALWDHGMGLQEALDMARVFPQDDAVEIERSVTPDAARGLADRGHTLRVATDPLGGAQAILVDHARGILTGASDPRKDGHAAGY